MAAQKNAINLGQGFPDFEMDQVLLFHYLLFIKMGQIIIS